jgi:hypothetical protein
MNNLNTYWSAEAVKSATRLVDAALASGYTVSVNDGEEWTVKKSTDRTVILDAMGTTGEDRLMVRNSVGDKVACYYLIYGNGSDVLSDWSFTDETMFESNRLANIAIDEKLFEEGEEA